MVLKVFSVFDSKVSSYLPPFFMPATGQALRAWESTVNDDKTEFYRYPGDFSLFEIGTFDQNTGIFTNHPSKINLGTALEFRRKPVEQIPQPKISKEGI